MIRLEKDLAFINRIANTDKVKPFIYYGDEDEIDFKPAFGGAVFLSNGEDAVAAFEQTEPRKWISHTMFAETCRGRRAVETGKEMVAYMIPRFADVLWGVTPMNNPQARWFNRQIGAIVVGHDEYPAEGPVEIFEVRAH